MGGSLGILGMGVLAQPAIAAKTNNGRPLASIIYLLNIQMDPGTFVVCISLTVSGDDGSFAMLRQDLRIHAQPFV